jgi:hypothetical protein
MFEATTKIEEFTHQNLSKREIKSIKKKNLSARIEGNK